MIECSEASSFVSRLFPHMWELGLSINTKVHFRLKSSWLDLVRSDSMVYWLLKELCSEAGLMLLYLCCLWRQILPCHAWFLLTQIAEGSVDKLARISAAFWVYKWSLHSCNSCTADAHTSTATASQASLNSTWNSWVSLVLAASHYTGQM